MSGEERQAAPAGSSSNYDSRQQSGSQQSSLPRLVVPDLASSSSSTSGYLISPPPWSTSRRPAFSVLSGNSSAAVTTGPQHQSVNAQSSSTYGTTGFGSSGNYAPRPSFGGSNKNHSTTTNNNSNNMMQTTSLPLPPALRVAGSSQPYTAATSSSSSGMAGAHQHAMVPPLSPTLFSAPSYHHHQVMPTLGAFPFPTPRSAASAGSSAFFGISPHGAPHGGFFTPTAQHPPVWFGQQPQQQNPGVSHGQHPPRMAPAISPHNSMYQLIGSSGTIMSMPSQDLMAIPRRKEQAQSSRSSASALIKRSSSSSADEPRGISTAAVGSHSPSASRTSSLSSMAAVEAQSMSGSPLLETTRLGSNESSGSPRKRTRLSRHSTSGEAGDGDEAFAALSSAADAAMFDFNGEGRLAIDFVNEGRLSILPPPFIGRKSVVPDGISGHFTSYGERWQFLVRYAKMHELVQGETTRQVIAVEWLIRNNAWNEYVSLVETLRDALRREDRGVTLCNRAFTLALDKRAGEYETALSVELAKQSPNQLRVANLSSRIKTLRPKRTSEGPLLFGLRHRSVQERFVSLIQSATGQAVEEMRPSLSTAEASAQPQSRSAFPAVGASAGTAGQAQQPGNAGSGS